MSGQPSQVEVGMTVVGSDGDRVGEVQGVGATDFLVSRGFLKSDVRVPWTAIRDITAGTIALNVPGKQVDAMDWGKGSLL